MARINQRESDLLKQYEFCRNDFTIEEDLPSNKDPWAPKPSMLLAVKTVNGSKELCTINRKSVTCWNRIRSWFKRGPLSHLNYSLTDVVKYLEQYEWEHLAAGENSEGEEKLFGKVSELAYKSYFYKYDDSLLKKVAVFERFKRGSFGYYHNRYLTVKYFLDMKRKQVIYNLGLDPGDRNFSKFTVSLASPTSLGGSPSGDNTGLTRANQLMYDIMLEGRRLKEWLDEGTKLHRLVSFDYKLQYREVDNNSYAEYEYAVQQGLVT